MHLNGYLDFAAHVDAKSTELPYSYQRKCEIKV